MGRFPLVATVVVLGVFAGGCSPDSSGSGGGAGSGPNLPTITLSASPNPAPYDEQSLITWATQNADVCLFKDGSGAIVAGGTTGSYITPRLHTETTYSLGCQGATGGASTVWKTVAIGVGPLPPPVATLSAEQNPAPYGGHGRLTWTSRYADTCVLRDAGEVQVAVGLNGTYTTPSLSGDSVSYSLECSNAVGTISEQIEITVQPMVEISIGTIWGLNIDGELGVFFLVRYWPKQNAISYYAENGVQITITSSELHPGWPTGEVLTSHPDATDNTDLVMFRESYQGSASSPSELAADYRIQLTFEGEVIDQTFSLDTVVVPHALPWQSILPTVYSDHITVSFTEAPAQYGYQEYVYWIRGGAGNSCDATLGYARGPHSPITVPVGQDGYFDCSNLYGQNWASEPTSSSIISVKKADPLPSYPLFSVGGRGLGY